MINLRKRRTREHVIADLSVNHVERFVLRMNPDYGIDLYMKTYNERGEVENGGVWFQLKATDHLSFMARGEAIPVRVEWRRLLFWLNERMPGILVVYDARQDKAGGCTCKRRCATSRSIRLSARSCEGMACEHLLV